MENIIAELVVSVLSLIISILVPRLMRKKGGEKRFDPLSVALFLELVSLSNLILNLSFWNIPSLNVFLVLVSLAFGYLIYYIYVNQCPSCKRFIRAKKRIDDKTIKEFVREWRYQPMKVWLYSNGRVWKEKPVGEEKTRPERWITKQEFYECNFCGFRWDSGHFDVNLDANTRPQPETVQTDKKDPNEYSFSLN